MGRWLAGVPEENWQQNEDIDQVLKEYWNDDYGDRRQQIVFIGLANDMDEANIRQQLDDCLIKDYLSSPQIYQELQDPFPNWF